MVNPDPNQPPADDPLAELRERIARTQQAAERLAKAAAGTPPAPPPAGWQTPGVDSPEARAIATLAETLRSLVPADLQEQISALVRELLLALRALIDYLVGRLERKRSEPVEVQDIPIG